MTTIRYLTRRTLKENLEVVFGFKNLQEIVNFRNLNDKLIMHVIIGHLTTILYLTHRTLKKNLVGFFLRRGF